MEEVTDVTLPALFGYLIVHWTVRGGVIADRCMSGLFLDRIINAFVCGNHERPWKLSCQSVRRILVCGLWLKHQLITAVIAIMNMIGNGRYGTIYPTGCGSCCLMYRPWCCQLLVLSDIWLSEQNSFIYPLNLAIVIEEEIPSERNPKRVCFILIDHGYWCFARTAWGINNLQFHHIDCTS